MTKEELTEMLSLSIYNRGVFTDTPFYFVLESIGEKPGKRTPKARQGAGGKGCY